MQVTINEQGYITNYALIGTLVDGIEIPMPDDLEHFRENFKAYTVNGFDASVVEDMYKQEQTEIYRQLREKECFPIINRGTLWYDQLTEDQKNELQIWYNRWLDVTETFIMPEKPEWLK